MIPETDSPNWCDIAEFNSLPSPSLLIYAERVAENLRRMIALAGDVSRLRPHIKTHKMPDLIRRQLELGISKFKCATIAEAEMAAACGVRDLLLAYQPVGPNAARLAQLIQTFPQTCFSVIADDAGVLRSLSAAISGLSDQSTRAGRPGVALPVLLDLDVGQHRTGVPADERAVELYRLIDDLPGLAPGGLHAYDGHIHDSDLAARTAACDAAFAPVARLRQGLLNSGLRVPRIVAGGAPTFPIHARRPGVECSPGTCVFWDAGYSAKLPDLKFLPAALLLTRVVSKPGRDLLCLDLGHKAVASEMPHPRVKFLNLPEAKALSHSEEHLVLQSDRAADFEVGQCLLGVPWHVCPTVALYGEALLVEQGRVTGSWKIAARERRLTV